MSNRTEYQPTFFDNLYAIIDRITEAVIRNIYWHNTYTSRNTEPETCEEWREWPEKAAYKYLHDPFFHRRCRTLAREIVDAL